jgi:broad specificity phosphatase PhoE
VRALGTASIIADALGGYPVEVWTELRELYTLKHRGFGRAELQRRFPQAILPASITDDGWEHGDPSFEAVIQRCQHVISMLKERFKPDDQVVMVAHGGLANALLHTILRISSTMPYWFAMDNCAISRVRLVPEQDRWGWPPLFPTAEAEIVYWNDVSHLTAISSMM